VWVSKPRFFSLALNYAETCSFQRPETTQLCDMGSQRDQTAASSLMVQSMQITVLGAQAGVA